ncbi:MAG: glycosyltransferase family 87 protein, partial [Solirubrobacteraceae bacterium]
MISLSAQQVLLGLVPLVVLVTLLGAVIAGPNVGVDFHNAYYVAGLRVLRGGDPYAWSAHQIAAGVAFVYPAFSALFFAPFALISRGTASLTFMFVCVALAPLTLWIMRVRDWRVYGATLLWLPFFGAWQTANETALLVALTALAWRYRDRPIVCGALAAAAISLKPLVWPLALWLLVTRRYRASAYGLAVGVVLNLASWAVVGFSNVSVYLHESVLDSRLSWRHGYSLIALAGHFGLGRVVGYALLVIGALALTLLVVYIGLVKRRERQALILAVALMLVSSPLVWSHYFLLLLIPLALKRPRMC